MYTSFANFYESFMEDIPYDEWVDYLTSLLYEQGIRGGLCLELGCGTGQVTRRLANRGYDMIGIDLSEQMLQIALEQQDSKHPILYLHQDMRHFELYGTVASIVSICDSMNYLLTEDELVKVFRLANNYLDANGCFVFDLKTEAFYHSLGNQSFVDQKEDATLIWENEFDDETKTNFYDLTIFAKKKNGLYERFAETHCQRAWSLSKIKRAIQKGGMEFVACYDAFTKNVPKPDTERIYVIARETFQENKRYESGDLSR